ncbi:FAD-dependent oxidoreductase [Streptomyces sp. NPDC056637]|uniref:FAD-dependent oxidoreductase n=1 Tax=unclassified Streptomyces TaxID=2593676 RepID=UPI00367C0B94
MTFRGPVLFHPDAGVINADASIAAMLDVARQNGAHLAAHTPVQAIDVHDRHVLVHTHVGTTVRARRVALAVGAWLPEFCAQWQLAGISLPPLQVTQQHVLHFPQKQPRAAWPVVANCGALVVLAGLASTSRWAVQSAQLIGDRLAEPLPQQAKLADVGMPGRNPDRWLRVSGRRSKSPDYESWALGVGMWPGPDGDHRAVRGGAQELQRHADGVTLRIHSLKWSSWLWAVWSLSGWMARQ